MFRVPCSRTLIFGVLLSCGAGTTAALAPRVRCDSHARVVTVSTFQEKESRTPEQQKIDSQLLYAIYQMRGEAAARGTPTETIPLRKDNRGRVLVDVRAAVTQALLKRITRLGGRIESTSARDYSILTYLKLEKLEALARLKEVKSISPAAEAMTQ